MIRWPLPPGDLRRDGRVGESGQLFGVCGGGRRVVCILSVRRCLRIAEREYRRGGEGLRVTVRGDHRSENDVIFKGAIFRRGLRAIWSLQW